MKKLLSWLKKDDAPETTEAMAPQEPETEESSAEEAEEDEVTLGTKIKVVAALAVVGFATYVAYWVQEPTDFKAQVIDADPPAAEEEVMMEEEQPEEEAMVAQVDPDDIDGPVQEIAIIDFTYTPANITVEEGTTVVWTNIDAVEHTVTGDFFTSEVLNPGDSFVYTFEQEGTFDYFCSIHPQMKGKVNVTAAASAPVETLPDNAVVSVDEDEEDMPTEVLSPALIGVDDNEAATTDIVTLDADEFLQEPPAEDDTLVLSLPEDAEARAAADQPDTLTKSGPEDVLYIGLFVGILYMTRRRLSLQNR